MQISVHAFPLSDHRIDNDDFSPVTQGKDAVKDAGKTEQQALGLENDKVSLSDQAKTSREAGDNSDDSDEKLVINPSPEKGNNETRSGGSEEKVREKAEQEVVKQQVDQLKQRDREVRAHELAHAVTGGAFAGSPKLEYTRGPDGVQYATGGEVSVDTAPIAGDPQATMEKARIVRAAALAPANPSGQDRAVAARASQMGIDASAELVRQRSESRAEQFSDDGQPEGDAPARAEGVSVYEGLKSDAQSGRYFDEVV